LIAKLLRAGASGCLIHRDGARASSCSDEKLFSDAGLQSPAIAEVFADGGRWICRSTKYSGDYQTTPLDLPKILVERVSCPRRE